MARRPADQTSARRALASNDARQDRALAPDPEEPHLVGTLLPAGRSRSPDRRLRRRLQLPPLSRETSVLHFVQIGSFGDHLASLSTMLTWLDARRSQPVAPHSALG